MRRPLVRAHTIRACRALAGVAPSLLALGLLAGGCSEGHAAPARSAAGNAAPHRCDELSQAFEARLAKATGRCRKKSDCGRYAAGVGRNCGGVTDRAAARALAAIAKEFFAQKCDFRVSCAPRAIRPLACTSRRCGEAEPLGPRR